MTDVLEGWLAPAEAAKLEELARGRVVLELGAYLGLSTVLMVKVARHVVSVDHHRGSPEHRSGGACHDPTLLDAWGNVDTLPRFLRNLRQNGVRREDLTVVCGDFQHVGQFLRSGFFDLVFVDGEHTTAAVERDAALAIRVVRPGGLVAFHDYNFPSVRLGVELIRVDIDEHDFAPPSLAIVKRKTC